jgi:hypothetical protein
LIFLILNFKYYSFYKMDLYGTNGNAIAMGNARMQAVRDFNDRVKQHNNDVVDKIQGLREQEKTADTINEIKTQATNLWTAKDIPGKVAEYNKWKASRNAPNPSEGSVRRTRQAPDADAEPAPVASTTEASAEAVSEAAPNAETVSEVAESSEGATGAVAKGLEKEGGEVAESAFGKAAGKVGVLGSAALGGMDLYEDIKSKKIVGNNDWEKASNLLQIGGTVGDLVGSFFPPAKLVGGVLDLASGITDTVGEKLDEDKQSDDLKTQQQKETEQTIAAPVQQTVATGRVQ